MLKRVLILGVTGSIGLQTIDVIKANPERFVIAGLSAGEKERELLEIAQDYPKCKLALAKNTTSDSRIHFQGAEGLIRLINECDADICVNGIAGSSGLLPSMAALRRGMELALANKESIVMAGKIIMDEARKAGTTIIPVDSEHSAIFNLIKNQGREQIDEILLTASGGAFRDLPQSDLKKVSLEDAMKHPNWNMGGKITIDSASLANKGLEVIEASVLFDLPVEKIKVLIHPQSFVHSLIRTIDGAMYAQISKPDMRLPIHSALSWPESLPCAFGRLDLTNTNLSFNAPDLRRFPMLGLAYLCAKNGASYPIAYNAANEIAVDAFIRHKIGFTDIQRVVDSALQHDWSSVAKDINEVMERNDEARKIASSHIRKFEDGSI